ncbi:LacI family transcriptional regulator, partial [Proteus terrae]
AATLLADRIEGGEDSGVIIDIGFQLVARESA